jgi:hypothetical protein
MSVKWRLALPMAMGLICAPLVLWDIHNLQVIESMGMAWDTGAPLWPYQTPETLLFALNTPAAFFSNVVSNLLGLIGPSHHILFFPAVIAWWWLVGLYFDKRQMARRTPTRRTPIWALTLCLLAIGLIGLGIVESRWAFRWWWTYSRSLLSVSDLIFLRAIAPSIWSLMFGLVALSEAWRRARSTISPIDPRKHLTGG